jgi:hypothetical protein
LKAVLIIKHLIPTAAVFHEQKSIPLVLEGQLGAVMKLDDVGVGEKLKNLPRLRADYFYLL